MTTWTISEQSPPVHRGLCEGCGLPSKLAVTAETDRPQGHLVLRFCDRDCWRRWKLRMERLPDVGLRIG